MAEAIVKGIIAKGLLGPGDILCSEPLGKRRQYLEETYGIQTFSDNREAVRRARMVLLSVKPQVMDIVLSELKADITRKHLVISIAAGVPLSRLESRLCKGARVIRVMPNTPALVQKGAAALAMGSNADDSDMEEALALFQAVGSAIQVDEHLMDAVTGLSGSGPAYCFMFIEALIQAGIREGLPRPVASELAIQTVIGSAGMCRETGRHPAELISMVTSPGGTTIQGIYHLHKSGITSMVMDAVSAAAERSRELGRQ